MVVERRCINLYSDMNSWMDLVLLVNDEDFDKAKEVTEKPLMIFGMIQKLKKNVGVMEIGLDGN